MTKTTHFWRHHPALLYGISLLLGCCGYFYGPFFVALPSLLLWLPFLITSFPYSQKEELQPLVLSLAVFAAAWGASLLQYSPLPVNQQGIKGKALVRINQVSLQHSPFGARWLYRCRIQRFYPEGSSQPIISSLPCLIAVPATHSEKDKRPPANQDYWVAGTLVQNPEGAYRFKTGTHTAWIAVSNPSWSWAERRLEWKQRVRTWIDSCFANPMNASFLAGLVTGEFDDPWMRGQFSRFGLQHLLAISGFHFSIVAAFLDFALRLFLPRIFRISILLLALGGYCFFLGPQPSILRAWIMCSLTLMGGLIHKQATALNSMGIALLALLAYDPFLCQELSFQLSFAATAAILLFYQPIHSYLCTLWLKRKFGEVIQMNLWHQHGYCLLVFLRQGLALALAVNVFALPLSLHYFYQFSWMSLLYNLFFPFLASGSMCLLLLGGGCFLIPPVANGIHRLNEAYTTTLLKLIHQMPSEMDHYLTVDPMHPAWIVLYFCLASLAGILWKERAPGEERDFAFI